MLSFPRPKRRDTHLLASRAVWQSPDTMGGKRFQMVSNAGQATETPSTEVPLTCTYKAGGNLASEPIT